MRVREPLFMTPSMLQLLSECKWVMHPDHHVGAAVAATYLDIVSTSVLRTFLIATVNWSFQQNPSPWYDECLLHMRTSVCSDDVKRISLSCPITRIVFSKDPDLFLARATSGQLR